MARHERQTPKRSVRLPDARSNWPRSARDFPILLGGCVLLCQRVATRSNKEDCQSGRFFQDRYKATLLADEASVLACAAYVDLNVIRAAMAETIEASDHTSAQRRFKAEQTPQPTTMNHNATRLNGQRRQVQLHQVQRLAEDDFLSPLTINERNDPVGPGCLPDNSRAAATRVSCQCRSRPTFDLLNWLTHKPKVHKREHPVLIRYRRRCNTIGHRRCDVLGNFRATSGSSSRMSPASASASTRCEHTAPADISIYAAGLES